MLHRVLKIGRWVVDFIFATEGYDEEEILDMLYKIDAPIYVMQRARRIMESGYYNRGFTFPNPELHRAVVVVGPTTSGRQFINTFSHEINHLSSEIADYYGVRQDKEAPAYITGDTTMMLAEVICHLGCDKCRDME